MRNGTYTIYQNLILGVKSNYAEDCLLWIEGKDCELKGFEKSKFEDAWYKIIEWEEIKEAFAVKTFGIYKGYKFQLFDFGLDSNIISIGTKDIKASKNLHLFEVGDLWFMTEVKLSDVESIWEERTPALNLPMPKGVEKLFVIK